LLSSTLPPDHLSGDSKDVVKLGMGLVGTMTAILLGLLVASAKNFYDTQNDELTEMSAKIILLDRVLAHYGPEAKEARDVLHVAVTRLLDAMWSSAGRENSHTASTPGRAEILYEKIQGLSPQNDSGSDLQRSAAQRSRSSRKIVDPKAVSNNRIGVSQAASLSSSLVKARKISPDPLGKVRLDLQRELLRR
jgi:hypothetical protein